MSLTDYYFKLPISGRPAWDFSIVDEVVYQLTIHIEKFYTFSFSIEQEFTCFLKGRKPNVPLGREFTTELLQRLTVSRFLQTKCKLCTHPRFLCDGVICITSTHIASCDGSLF